MEIATSYRKEKMWDGAKDKRIAANDDDSEKPTHNKIPRKENMQDKQIAATDADSYKPVFLRAKELLKVSYDVYKETLNHEQQRLWLTAHFLLRRRCSDFIFKDKRERDEKYVLELTPSDVYLLTYSPWIVEENMMQQDKQIAAATEVESDSEIIKMDIVCSDGISIDAKLFEKESRLIQDGYEYDYGFIEVESNSLIIKKVEFFCAKRAQIQNDYAHDEILVQHKLNEFNSDFRQIYPINPLHLIIAAFDLEIKSLMDLMMEDVADMFTKMTTDEVYKILSVNLKECNNPIITFELMQEDLTGYEWAFEGLK